MIPSISSIKTLLSETPPYFGDCGIHSLLEFLWHSYTELNPVDNDTLRSLFLSLEPLFDFLSIEESDRLFTLLTSLITETERQAFLDGMQLGFRLIFELDEFQRNQTASPMR